MKDIMVKFKFMICCLLLSSFFIDAADSAVPLIDGERHIVLLSCSYNNAKYYQRNLDSVFVRLIKHIV